MTGDISKIISRKFFCRLIFTITGNTSGYTECRYFGGLVGLVLAFYIFCKDKKNSASLEFSDLFAPAVPLAYAFGRLGNFLNGELYGRVTKVPWGMYFPLDITGQLRHPSQLYEMFLEGILLFIILWSIRKSYKFPGGYLTVLLSHRLRPRPLPLRILPPAGQQLVFPFAHDRAVVFE